MSSINTKRRVATGLVSLDCTRPPLTPPGGGRRKAPLSCWVGVKSRFHSPLTLVGGGSLPLSRDESSSFLLGLLFIQQGLGCITVAWEGRKYRPFTWFSLLSGRDAAAVFSVMSVWSRAVSVFLKLSDLWGCSFLGPLDRESRLFWGCVPIGIFGLPASPAASLEWCKKKAQRTHHHVISSVLRSLASLLSPLYH